MDLTTRYLGRTLRSPIMASASPLSQELDSIRRMEDAGLAAVTLYSLFEEQLRLERFELHHHMTQGTESFAESLTYFPEPEQYHLGPEEYLEHIRKAKEAVGIPVFASLNGSSKGGWVEYAKLMEQAGADAIELNIYYIPTDMRITSTEVEQKYLDIVTAVREEVSIPVAVKLGPFFSNMANMAKRLDDAGAGALVLFNRFYQPDIDLEELTVKPNVLLSTPQAMRLPMRWIAILHGRLGLDLAATSGVHTAEDVIKMTMAGASVCMLCSVLLKKGVAHARQIEDGIRRWMEEREYDSIDQMRGSMSQERCEDPAAFERAQYMRGISSVRADQFFAGK